MITIKKQLDRNGEFHGSYLGNDGRYYPESALFDSETGDKLFEFTLVEMSQEEVAAIKPLAEAVDAENELELVRQRRDQLLKETDWWAYQDTPDMTPEQAAYRQALRDITKTYSSIAEVVWPEKP